MFSPLDDPDNPEFTNHPDRKVFLTTLRDDPEDALTRAVYADWLADHGHYAEADRQREYHAARKWLKAVATDCGGNTDYDGDTYSVTTLADLVNAGRAYITSEGEDYYVQYGHESLRNFMHQGDHRNLYWKHWSTLTGEAVPEKYRTDSPFSCSC